MPASELRRRMHPVLRHHEKPVAQGPRILRDGSSARIRLVEQAFGDRSGFLAVWSVLARRDLVTGKLTMSHLPHLHAPNPQGRNHRCNRTRKTANR